MPVIDLSAYKPVPATLGDANQIANGMQAIQNVVNALDNNNFAAGKIFDPTKLMQNGAATGQALLWNGTIWAPAGAGAMVQLFDSSLGVSAASFDISGIAQTYSHLKLVLYVRGDAALATQDTWARFNGDSAGNYDDQDSRASAAVANSHEFFAQTQMYIGNSPGSTAGANLFSVHTIDILNYANAANNKALLSMYGCKTGVASGNITTGIWADFWRSNAAITRVTILPASGNFVAGSRATLYGVL